MAQELHPSRVRPSSYVKRRNKRKKETVASTLNDLLIKTVENLFCTNILLS